MNGLTKGSALIRDQRVHSSGQARPGYESGHSYHGAELLPLSPATSFTRSTYGDGPLGVGA